MASSEHGLPEGFGKQASQGNDFLIGERYDKARRTEYVERLKNGGENDNKGSDSDSSDDSDDDNELEDLPTTHQLVLRGHTKKVSSISLDPSGSRLLTGSFDCTFKYWDFAGMDSIALNPFRSFEPMETHSVLTCAFSASGKSVLAVPQSLKPKLYTRDGKELGEFASGYVYLVDMKNTKGHTADMTGGAWNPVENDTFCTSSVDSTIRIWNANRFNSQKSVIVVKPVKGGIKKNKVTTSSWSLDGKLIVGASIDGALTTWDAKGPLLRPSHTIKEATVPNTWTSGITASPDGNMYAIRGGDGSLKLWDLRNLKTPVLQRLNLPSDAETNNVVYSPDGAHLLTGTSDGQLHILDKDDLSDIQTLQVDESSSSVASVSWHPKLNQIFAGLSNGSVHVMFNRNMSTKGAKIVIEKAPKVRHVEDAMNTTDISMFGISEDAYEQERQRKERRRKVETISEPTKPNPGVWGTPDPEHVKQNVELSGLGAEDPREALLKYAEKAEKEPPGFLAAYKKTQPKKLYENDDDGDKEAPPSKKPKNQ
ncbi:hypothetical protein TRICI_006825 [Trichomonascus ciferrii]|uniref:Anaphase-promoting complex subunit 4 WD40 domain-containing protein n=1 Tax=Trichomonascus ciferrii TaxID=44093 RepID=A0A642UCP4_9ASCO|nr:hypothetical protein TRICI_006825 [Trichomonascus ciferrii]